MPANFEYALDPKTAKKVLDITEEIVAKDNLITVMITHNMADAIRVGNRLIMMHDGQIVVDVKGEEKKKLTIEAYNQNGELVLTDVIEAIVKCKT